MKKLHIFDSLKFVRAMFVTVIAIFAFAPAHAATLPVGYTELEYIEGTGTQWIDTGIKITSNDIIETEFKNTSSTKNGGLYGVFALGSSSALYANGTYYGYDVANNKVNTNVSVDTTWHNVIHNFVDGTLKLDDTTVEFAPFSFENNVNSHLFTRYYDGTYGYYFSGYVKKHKITRNGVVIINLIPARRDIDGVVGMYDLANPDTATAFHTNEGTGNFIAGEYKIKIATTHYNEQQFAPVETDLDAAVAVVDTVVSQTMTQAQQIDDIANNKQTRPEDGCSAKYCLLVEDEQGVPHWYPIAGVNGVAHALPAGYTELQYIESTGTQYIDTGLKGTQDTKVVLDFQLSGYNDNGYILGCRSGNNARAFLIGSYNGRFSSSGDSYPFARFDSVSPTMVQQEPNFDLNRHIYELSSGGFYIDGVLYSTYSNPTNFSTPENITLFGRYSAGDFAYGIFRAYGLKLYNGNNLVRDLIPAKNSSGVVGMYDLADPNPSTAFYTNAGTGTFTAGPNM